MKQISILALIALMLGLHPQARASESASVLQPGTFTAISNDNQKSISALFDYATFYQPGQKAYMETYLSFDAWNINFVKKGDKKYQATAEVYIAAVKNDSVVYSKRYNVESPVVEDPQNTNFNFLDVQRFALAEPGIYTIRILLKDHNDSQAPVSFEEKVLVNYTDAKPMMSSVKTVSRITKTTTSEPNILSRYGYDLEPYPDNFFPENIGTLNYFYEIYNIQQEIGSDPFMTVSYVERYESGSEVANTRQAHRQKSANLVPVIESLDIAALPSGNYNLVVEVRNKENEKLLYGKFFFIRSNPSVKDEEESLYAGTFVSEFTNEDSLDYYLDALYPIASPQENAFIQKLLDLSSLDEKQAFMYKFWSSRDKLDPKGEWLKYKKKMDVVESMYSYPLTRGYRTDRGRVYLQYGAPDFIRDEKNFVGSAGLNKDGVGHLHYLPYQLWRYNLIPGDLPDRVFIFWDEFRSGFYKLLNANAKGEVQEFQWERRLSQGQLEEGLEGDVGRQFNRGY